MFFLRKLLLQHTTRLRPYNRLILGIMDAIIYPLSLFFVLGVVYEYGFTLAPEEIASLNLLYNVTWVVFLVNIGIRFLLEELELKRTYRLFARILIMLLLFTLLPVIIKDPQWSIARSFWAFLGSKFYRILLLLLFSLLQLFYGVVRLLGRRSNPSLILATSFLIIIFIGMGLLMLPHSTVNGINWTDALFIATSSVCVTGLSSVDIPTVFTPEGQFIIALLVQIGGVGVMTFTSFFALFFMGNTTLYNQLAITDMVSSNSLSSLFSTLIYILVFTLSIELVGMLFLFIDIHGTMGMNLSEEIAFAAFHAISGFCNAGFSILPEGLSNQSFLHGHRLFYLTIAFLIILGSIGFPILSNFRTIILYHLKNFWHFLKGKKAGNKHHQLHLYNLNTKIVLTVTLILLVSATAFVALLEWNNALAHMAPADKLLHSFFNATSLRTAGFNSVPIPTLSLQTVLIVVFLMFIGGGAQSTAGGIKVNTFAVIVLNLWAVVRGREQVEVFGRELTADSIRRSNATLLVFILVLFIAVFCLTIVEPDVPVLALTFECTSALSTAGSSLDVSTHLGKIGKLIISFLMFIGRVGIITLMLGLIRRRKIVKYKYPKEEIIIN